MTKVYKMRTICTRSAIDRVHRIASETTSITATNSKVDNESSSSRAFRSASVRIINVSRVAASTAEVSWSTATVAAYIATLAEGIVNVI